VFEHAMLVLARACGIATAESRLTTVTDHDVLLVNALIVKRRRAAIIALGWSAGSLFCALRTLTKLEINGRMYACEELGA